ncbi:intraflagellar transport protein 140 homolog [Lutzomyia longipalpis]|uniref:intraflagellar transport protein 140 homolog n=1 Tax=Lutzomyia longipalpis TaxID=7200 RepID=UPI0024836CC9|nr:intraflagellar transport protein 140 homolog [Lutzomyia longipalpis]
MTLFFDTKVQFPDQDAVSTVAVWHRREPLLAVASYSQDRGGTVAFFSSDTGEIVPNVTFPVNPVSQATALAWHPEKKLLVSGWENGEILTWSEGSREFTSIKGLHKGPIVLLAFSESSIGGRLVSGDSMGVLTGWRCDSHGQFLTAFTHELRDPFLHVTFRRHVHSPVATELTNLARAAVAGDESALDTLTNWRPRTAARGLTHAGVKDNHCFYVGTQSGAMFYVNQAGTCTEVLRLDNCPIIQVLWHPKRDAIVALMEDMTVAHYFVESGGNLTELDRVKLSGRKPGYNGMMSWAGSALAIITGDLSVRIWDIDTSDNFLLPMEMPENKSEAFQRLPSEAFTCLAFCPDTQTLCAGTNQGNLFNWRRMNYAPDASPENIWQLNNVTAVRGAVKQCSWGVTEIGQPCIVANCISNVFILKEQLLASTHCRDLWVIQKTTNQCTIEHSSERTKILDSDISITSLALSESFIAVSNGKNIAVFKVSTEDELGGAGASKAPLKVKAHQNFAAESLQLFLHDQNVILLTSNDVRIVSLSGVLLQEISFKDTEGKPIGADLTGSFLTVFTMNGYLRIYDVSRHEPKLVTSPKSGHTMFDSFGEFIVARCNLKGTHLAATVATESLLPDGKLYLWDIEKDVVHPFDFFSAVTKNDHFFARLPVSFKWDTDDARLVVCEVRCIQQKSRVSATEERQIQMQTVTESQACVMFISERSGFQELETINLAPGEQLVNLCAPHVITLKINSIGRIALRDFKGLEKCDPSTRKMVLDFSLNVAQGNMDHAFRCIKSIQSEAVWRNLAQMCVHTGRLDVAKVCLGHLRRASSVRALRRAMEDDTLEKEARIAVLAIELDMIEEAEALYKKCGRYDLLNRLLQACGRFEEALQIAEQCDRVHLKNTYFKYAEWLRESGDIDGAIKFFDKSLNSTHNITQMLIDDPVALRQYMMNTTDTNLLKWWGQYIESTGDMETAFKIYQKADDWFSQVRILCFLGQLSRAETTARHSGDHAACYHLARHYENIGRPQEAIQFYTRAQTYGNAVRICRENDLREDLWTVANAARGRDKAAAASYFEECGEFKRAVELYHRSGMLHKAVEMAFASQQPETLQVIASELDASSDPELVSRCADFFLSIEQAQKAVQLLANTRQFERALEICRDRGVPVTETFAELLTPSKDEADDETRGRILITLGELLQEQGDYHTATKKFTQAGDKVRAMKSLLKSGDTEKIIFFASMSRQKEVYIMAANYLQALNWQSDAKILKNIVTFYSKGQAFDLLANFYVTCAQVEIDEYRDYEKALKALMEANRCIAKVPNAKRSADQLELTIGECRRVLELQESMSRGENQAVIAGCRNILAHSVEKPPVRHTDILALLVEAFAASRLFPEALNSLKDLTSKSPDWASRGLVEKSLVERICAECGVLFETIWTSGRQREIPATPDDDNEEEIQEMVFN